MILSAIGKAYDSLDFATKLRNTKRTMQNKKIIYSMQLLLIDHCYVRSKKISLLCNQFYF